MTDIDKNIKKYDFGLVFFIYFILAMFKSLSYNTNNINASLPLSEEL